MKSFKAKPGLKHYIPFGWKTPKPEQAEIDGYKDREKHVKSCHWCAEVALYQGFGKGACRIHKTLLRMK